MELGAWDLEFETLNCFSLLNYSLAVNSLTGISFAAEVLYM